MKNQKGNAIVALLIVVVVIIALFLWFGKPKNKMMEDSNFIPEITSSEDLENVSQDLDDTDLNQMDSELKQLDTESSSM